MKEVIIKSKIVGKESAIGSGKPIAFPDLSAYALRSDFIRLESSFNDFLEGDDTDNVINRWKELEAFLNNISEDYNLLSLLNGKADKATTLSGYGITDAYTKTNVDDLLKSYVTLGGTPQTITGEKNFSGGLKVNGSPIYYDTEKKYWKLEGDLLVTGGVTMYGNEGTYTPSTIMDAILYDDTTLGINSNGQLYVKGGTSGGGLDITALQNYLTQNSYLNVTSGDNRYLQLSGGTLSGNIVLQGGYLNFTNSSGSFLGAYNVNDSGEALYLKGSTWNRILHSGNYSNYALPLSGGTLDGVLTLRASSSSSDSWIEFSNKSNSVVHKLGVRRPESSYGLQYYNGSKYYKIWHEGNFTPSDYLPLSGGTITSASPVSVTLNANNDGQTALFLQSKGTDKTYVGWDINRGTCLYDFSSDSHFGILNGIPRFNSNTIWHSGNDGDGSGLEADTIGTYKKDSGEKTIIYGTRSDNSNIRRIYDNGWNLMCQNGSDNGVIATLNSNVASATKLQTARTIWGQSFDGTGNVSGALSDVTGITFKDDYYGLVIDAFGNFSFKKPYSTAAADWSFKDSSGNKLMIINNSGKVGIGTTSPAAELDVKGVIVSSNFIAANWGANGIYLSGLNINIHNSSNSLVSTPISFTTSGNVGIGTTSPSSLLQVYGDGRISDIHFKAAYMNLNRDGATSAIYDSTKTALEIEATQGVSILRTYNVTRQASIVLHTNGNIGIGTISPSANLHVSGNILATGGITMYSMRALKNVVNERGLSLSELSTIKPTRYTWKDGRDNRLHFGGIADDIQQVLPEVVYSTSDGILTMDYGNAAFAVASSLIQPVVDHEKRIAMLEEENKQLRLEIERFKSA